MMARKRSLSDWPALSKADADLQHSVGLALLALAEAHGVLNAGLRVGDVDRDQVSVLLGRVLHCLGVAECALAWDARS